MSQSTLNLETVNLVPCVKMMNQKIIWEILHAIIPKGLSDYWQDIRDYLIVLIVPIELNFKTHFYMYKEAYGWTVLSF